MKRDLSKLTSQGSAAAANTGGLMTSANKDKVQTFDPIKDIHYDPSANVRNKKTLTKESLVELRLSLDNEQLQPIRVYPLSAQKKLAHGYKADQDVFGIAIGHRRVLACRLTSKDDPRIGDRPRKVSSLIDYKWLERTRSEKIKIQADENNDREDLNFVEFGELIRDWRDSKSQEEERLVPQRELMSVFRKTEKTIGYLIQAADFDDLAKDACHLKVLNDLDALVTFDAIAKTNKPFAQAIYNSLLNTEAPRTRALIRTAKSFIEANPDFKVDPKTWEWPLPEIKDNKPAVSAVKSTTTAAAPAAPAAPVTDNTSTEKREISNHQTEAATDGAQPGTGGLIDLEYVAGNDESTKQSPATTETSIDAGNHAKSASDAKTPEASQAQMPTVMVSFKMAEEAKTEFMGELILNKAAASQKSAVVAYLNEGKEEQIDVPLKFIKLMSISR